MDCRRIYRWSRQDVAWCVVGFIALQAALAIAMERWQPELRDPEYGFKLARLRTQLAQAPQRPLVVALGSSRTLNGLRPDLLEKRPIENQSPQQAPLVFNFGLSGYGPIQQLVCLRRLVNEGIHPRLLLWEIVPPLLSRAGAEPSALHVERQTWKDLRVLERFSGHQEALCYEWCESRLVPWFSSRFAVLTTILPGLVPCNSRNTFHWDSIDSYGWMPLPTTSNEAERQHAVVRALADHKDDLRNFAVAPGPAYALQMALQLCARQKVAVALFLMPEGSEFRGLYDATTEQCLETYLTGLRQKFDVPIIDARTWVADDGFRDSQHLLPHGAARFTERLRCHLPACATLEGSP